LKGDEDNRRLRHEVHKLRDSRVKRQPSNENVKQPESAHVCPQCGTPILIEDIGLRETTSGIVTCPKCDWSGKIDIRIVRDHTAG
jgi:predicted RNA-binding Zn-ribbon protein involved in translation (DUF1610 family)